MYGPKKIFLLSLCLLVSIQVWSMKPESEEVEEISEISRILLKTLAVQTNNDKTIYTFECYFNNRRTAAKIEKNEEEAVIEFEYRTPGDDLFYLGTKEEAIINFEIITQTYNKHLQKKQARS